MSIKKGIISGTKWTTISMGVQVVVQLARLSILTRFLEKSDFGLVAIVSLILTFTHIFTDLGISVVLFSKDKLSQREYSSLYWISIFSGLILYLLLLIVTPAVASFYQLPLLKSLIPIMGLDLIFATAGRQFRVFLQKELRFNVLAYTDIATAIISLFISVFLAYKHFGVYSLIISTIFNSFLASFILIWFGRKNYPIIFFVEFRNNAAIYKKGFYQTGAQILDFISNQLDIIIIGKVMGASDLGTYNLIKQLVLRPFNLISPIITNVSIPILSKLRSDEKTFNGTFLKMLELISYITFPLYGLMAVFANEIIRILYGNAYLEGVIPFQILCIWGAVASLLSSASVLVVVTGKTNLGFNWTIFRVFTNPIFIVVGSFWGITGFSAGQSVCIITYLYLYWYFFIKRASTISLPDYQTIFLRIFLTTIIAALISILVQKKLNVSLNFWLADIISVILFLFFMLVFGFKKIQKLFIQLKP